MKEQWHTVMNNDIFKVGSADFLPKALEVFRFQYEHNPVYADYCKVMGMHPGNVELLTQIPFLPISFFKTHPVQTGVFEPETIFESSGTTGSVNSRHFVLSLDWYKQTFLTAFENQYGRISDYCVLALLPSYLERQHSSLVWMAKEMIGLSRYAESGFYLYNFDELYNQIQFLEHRGVKCLLLGVSFALLDFAQQFPFRMQHTLVMETGGMKGRRKEMTRAALHASLCEAWQLPGIHSEYGMTELMSQAYATQGGIFRCPRWMKVLVREEDDPLLIKENGRGAVNIIDLANISSCAFIATDDAGMVDASGSFEILGRIDNSDIRGCSLMAV